MLFWQRSSGKSRQILYHKVGVSSSRDTNNHRTDGSSRVLVLTHLKLKRKHRLLQKQLCACGDTPLTTVTDTNNGAPKGVHNANIGNHKLTSAYNNRSLIDAATNGSNAYQIPTRYGVGFNALSASKAGNNFGAKMSIPDSIEKSGQGR